MHSLVKIHNSQLTKTNLTEVKWLKIVTSEQKCAWNLLNIESSCMPQLDKINKTTQSAPTESASINAYWNELENQLIAVIVS